MTGDSGGEVVGASAEVFEDSEGEKVRAETFAEVPMWRGKVLKWSCAREFIFAGLRQVVGTTNMGLDTPDALRILWICSVEPREIYAVKPSAILVEQAVEAWVAENVEMDELEEAVKIAFQIYNLVDNVTPERVTEGGEPGEVSAGSV